MRQYRFLQLDVFTDRAFGGNQLAVFTAATGLTDTEMQAIAKEMNFAESTFILPARDAKALCRVRIFTPANELPFAGHPVIGTTFALAHDGRVRAADTSPITLDIGIGLLPVDVLFEGERLSFAWMHQPVPTYTTWNGDRERLVAALGLDIGDIAHDLPIEGGSSGVPFVYVPVRSLEALRRAGPGADLVAALRSETPRTGAYVFALEGYPATGEVRARMFAPGMGIPEDAATGSAAGPFGVYLLRHGRIQPDEHDEARVRILQGAEMGRSSRLDVAITAPANQVRDVRVGGEAVVVAEGTLMLPD